MECRPRICDGDDAGLHWKAGLAEVIGDDGGERVRIALGPRRRSGAVRNRAAVDRHKPYGNDRGSHTGSPGRRFDRPDPIPRPQSVLVLLNAVMGLPPVLIGLAVYLALSRSGPLGRWGLLFTPLALVIAQIILVTPIIAALTRQTVEDLWVEYRDELLGMDVRPLRRVTTLLWDARFSLVTALLAGFGRAAAEVGAIIIVGGNIAGYTRTMTTAIALRPQRQLGARDRTGDVLLGIIIR